MRPMSEKLLPEHLDPFRYAEQGLSLDGILKITDMQRLAVNLADHSATVSVNLQFGIDEQKITFLNGNLKTRLTLQCQRCMEPLVYEIMSDFSLGVVSTLDEANVLPEHYEPAMAAEGSLALKDLIEDEILLNLPIIPRHEPEDCKVKLPLADSGWEEKDKGVNPFQVLESLKEKRK